MRQLSESNDGIDGHVSYKTPKPCPFAPFPLAPFGITTFSPPRMFFIHARYRLILVVLLPAVSNLPPVIRFSCLP